MTDTPATDDGTAETDAAGWEATRADVYDRLRACEAGDRKAALAVITDVEGSAYRRPGAKLVVTDDAATGAITAGCLEGPVAEAARGAIEAGRRRIETYDLTADDDTWGMGLGCNGVVTVLIDPLDGSLTPALDAVARKERATVLTVVDSDDAATPANRTTVLAAGSRVVEGRDGVADDVVDAVADAVGGLAELERAQTLTVEVDGDAVTVFCDVFEPVPDLLVFGRQGDVRPVARFGREAGFRVRVVTGRGASAEPSRFPAAASVHGTRAPDIADVVDAPAHTYAVVMSHNFVDDRVALEALLDAGVPYVGLMGPRERFEQMREAFDDPLDEAALDRISTPVGLDLGGDDPTQIALSVVAEALAVANGRAGGRLSDTDGPIHGRR